MPRGNELLAALMGAQAGGFLAQPPGLDSEPGLGIPGVSGVPRGRTWDAFAAVSASELEGDAVAFVVLADGTVVVAADAPDGAVSPLADALEETIAPPYRAAALRSEGDVWSAVAEKITVVELGEVTGDLVELTVVDGVRELTVDGQPATERIAALDALADEHGDVALHAERIDGGLFAVDVFPL
jgi:hypothetical protein